LLKKQILAFHLNIFRTTDNSVHKNINKIFESLFKLKQNFSNSRYLKLFNSRFECIKEGKK
jgi:hypothetical protein